MKYVILLFISIALSCCGSADTENEAISRAESELASGNISEARIECDRIVAKRYDYLSSSQLCRIAMIYVKLSEQTGEEEDMAAATQCFLKAIDVNPDSVNTYLMELSIEEQSHAALLQGLSRSLDRQYDLSDKKSDDSMDFMECDGDTENE